MRISFQGYEPAHLSYSSMDGYRSCGARFKLQKVENVEQRPGVAALGGNAVHTATEWWDLGTHGDLTPESAFRQAWDEEVAKRMEQSPSYKPEDFVVTGRASKEYGGKKNIQWWMDNGPKMVQSWIDWRVESGWHLWETPDGRPAVEVELNITLPNDIPIKMFLDRIMVTPAGQIVVVDIKTGRIPDTGEQLGLYRYGIEQVFGPEFAPDWGYYWSPDKHQGPPVALGMYDGAYFADLSSGVAAGVNAGVFLAKPMNNCFAWCSVSAHCPVNPANV